MHVHVSGFSVCILSIETEFHWVNNLGKYKILTNCVANSFPLITSNLLFYHRKTFVNRKNLLTNFYLF